MKKTLLIVIPCSMILLACPTGCRPLAQAGISPRPVKTIVPSFDIEVDHYDVQGTGPDSTSFSLPGVTTSEFAVDSLAAGEWTITVDAYNADLDPVGSGTVVVTVKPATVISESIAVTPLTGTGSLSITVSWPSGSIADPDLFGQLVPVGGSAQDLSFSVGSDSASCSVNDLEAGYFSLLLRLSDGAVVEWGAFEAVRIMEGLTTTANFILDAQDLFSGD